MIDDEEEKIYRKTLPIIKNGFSQPKGQKILQKSLATDSNEQINIANEIADKLKEASLSHEVLNEL